MKRSLVLLIALHVLLSSRPSAQDWGSIEQDVASLHDRWEVPGIAVGVVLEGEEVWRFYRGACGENEEPIGGETLFDLGSVSKTFTAAAALSLVATGELKLDAAVRDYLPNLRFPNARLDRRASLRDLLGNRTGITADNTMFWEAELSRAEVLERVRFLSPATPLDQSFQYHNVMFLAAGEAIGASVGQSWEAVLGARLLEPLGMRRTYATRQDVGNDTRVAHPHVFDGKTWKTVPFVDLANCAPAGAMVSCLDDMLIWMRMLLGDGQLEDDVILTPAALAETWEPHIDISAGLYRQFAPVSSDLAYGLGFSSTISRGRMVVEHGGQTDGMHALLFMVPDEGFGVVTLTNALHIGLPHAISYLLAAELLEIDGVSTEAEEAFWSTWEQMASSMTDSGFVAPSSQLTLDAATRLRACGTYTSGRYGDAVIREVDGGLCLDLLGRTGQLHATAPGQFTIDWREDRFLAQAAPGLTLNRGTKPGLDRLVLRGVSFSRVLDPN